MRRALLLGLTIATSGCGLFAPFGPSVPHQRATQVGAALRADAVRPTYLRYAMKSGDEDWSLEIVNAGSVFAERRKRVGAGGGEHVLGVDARGAFLRVAGRPAVWLDGGLDSETRTRAAVFGLGFTRPAAGDVVDIESGNTSSYVLVHKPREGSSAWVTIDRASSMPIAIDTVSSDDRPLHCEDLVWDDVPGKPRLLSRARCSGIVSDVGRHTIELTLQAREELGQPPVWAAGPAAPPDFRPAAPFEVAIGADPTRVYLPTEIGGKRARFIVDTGAAMSTVTESQAKELGVVPLPERPRHVKPPWLATESMWVGVIDELKIGGHSVRGQRVYVMRDDAGIRPDDGVGLLGVDVLRRFVVDVDSPRGAIVVRPRDGFDADGAETLWVKGLSHQSVTVKGEIDGVAKGDLILDTGAPIDVVVHHYRMGVAHPRQRGSGLDFAWGEKEVSPDYASEIEGMSIGPFHFPQMPAIGRDRERERLGCGVALVGMGLMKHFRVAFDLGHQLVHLWPGDSYVALDRAGLELEERDAGAVVVRVAARSESQRAGLKPGDVLRAVNGKRVTTARDALAAIAASKNEARVTVSRDGRTLAAPIAMR